VVVIHNSEIVEQLRRTVEQAQRADEEAATFRARAGRLQAENANLRLQVAEHEQQLEYLRAVNKGQRRRYASLEADLDRASHWRNKWAGWYEDKCVEFDRYREYTTAGFKTLYHERRYGPAPGAPGTEKIQDGRAGSWRVVVYPVDGHDFTPVQGRGVRRDF
jgi:hypothetical protein